MSNTDDRVIRHEHTDDWKVRIDGKTYWVKRFSVDGKESSWLVEVVRLSPNGQNPYCRDVNEDSPIHKKVVAWVKKSIST